MTALQDWLGYMWETPFVDSHSHVMPQGIGRFATGNRPFAGQSRLAGLLTGYGSLLCFLAAGMEQRDIDGIRLGDYDRERCKRAVLSFLPKIETALPIAFCRRGLSLLVGEPVERIDEGSWDALERVLDGAGDDYDRLGGVMSRDRIQKTLLNLWTGWSASYYGKYRDAMTQREREADARLYAGIATFDSSAIAPFTAPTREYARLLGEDAESFDGYDRLIEALADYLVLRMGAKGFKISECYFRPLDYQPVAREQARRCFCENPDDEQRRTLSNYVTWKVLEQARRLRVPVQVHTGELWGDTKVEPTSPMHLLTALRAFPEVSFDLLHCGYPYMAETGILATNLTNVYVNLSYMPLRSLNLFGQWLDVYCNEASSDRVLLGTDVFDPECMAGCVAFIRDVCAEQAGLMEKRGIASPAAIRSLFARLLHENASRLYRLEH